jgi:tetratricopeptide (TPR) repeat protein
MDLSKHLENAAEAVKRRNYPFAIKVYGQLLAIQPDHGDARRGLHEALFKKASQKKPSRMLAMLFGGVHLAMGHALRICGRHGAAAKSFERYLAMDPLHEGTNLALGTALMRSGNRKSALAVYRAFADAEPKSLVAARSAGALHYQQGQMQDALQMYEQALRIEPRDMESLKARKDLAAEGALRNTGIVEAKGARELVKDKASQQQIERSQRIQLTKEEIGSELDKLEEELQQRPDDQKLLRRTGRLREMDGDVQGALDLAERALQGAPGDGELKEWTADLRLRLQEQMVQKARASGDREALALAQKALFEAQVVEYRRRVEHNPADLGLRYQLGAALLEVGQVDAAIAELQQGVKDPRKKGEALFRLGAAFRKKQLPDLAMGQYEKALAALSGAMQKEVLYEMGSLCQERGLREDALRHFSRILETDIGFRDVANVVERLKAS